MIIECSRLIAIIAMLAGCKKINDHSSSESLVSGKLQDAVNQDKCRLQRIQWNDGYLVETYDRSPYVDARGDITFTA